MVYSGYFGAFFTRCAQCELAYAHRMDWLLLLVDTVSFGFNLANIALAVQLKRAGWREATVPIRFRRNAGPTSAVPLMRSFGQLLELCGQLLLLPRPVLRPVA